MINLEKLKEVRSHSTMRKKMDRIQDITICQGNERYDRYYDSVDSIKKIVQSSSGHLINKGE